MLFEGDICIGFLSLREQPDYLYIHTLQLIRQYRRQGIGTKLLGLVGDMAKKKLKIKFVLQLSMVIQPSLYIFVTDLKS